MENINLPLSLHFNPHSPRGERPGGPAKAGYGFCISIHTPREGSDTSDIPALIAKVISIHTPREGSDIRQSLFCRP